MNLQGSCEQVICFQSYLSGFFDPSDVRHSIVNQSPVNEIVYSWPQKKTGRGWRDLGSGEGDRIVATSCEICQSSSFTFPLRRKFEMSSFTCVTSVLECDDYIKYFPCRRGLDSVSKIENMGYLFSHLISLFCYECLIFFPIIIIVAIIIIEKKILFPVLSTAAETQFQRKIRRSEKTMEGGENLSVLAGTRAYSPICLKSQTFRAYIG